MSRPRRVSLLYTLTLVGGLLAIGLAVGGAFWLDHEVSRPSPRSQVLTQYAESSRACPVRPAAPRQRCLDRALAVCIEDRRWHDDVESASTQCTSAEAKALRSG